uniref:DDE Tnp4 domain-containing protein n=1 Tax=Astatotilapia calliptera TaxID=8154 RepID=A0AAX7U936_ASTCA
PLQPRRVPDEPSSFLSWALFQEAGLVEKLRFPGVIGCTDGTHIPIIAPSVNEGDYVNRKSFHSINVQIICDAANIITNVEAKWPGSVHDSQIFRECTLSTKFGHGEFTGYLFGIHVYPICLPLTLTLNRAHSSDIIWLIAGQEPELK